MSPLRHDARLVELAFQYGLVTGQAIIDWADAEIITLPAPPPQLIELSTTPNSRTADLLAHLRALAADANYWDALRAVLGLLYERISSRPESTDRFASEVYSRLITSSPARLVPCDLPIDLQYLYEFADKFDLAQQGIRGDPQAMMQEYLGKLQSFEKFKRVPPGLVLEGRTSGEWPIGFGSIVTFSQGGEASEPVAALDPLTARAKSRSSKHPQKRGLRFLVGGVVGGTLLVAVISLVVHDWSYLTRWLSGLLVIALVFVYVEGKRWLSRRAVYLATHAADETSRIEKPDAEQKSEVSTASGPGDRNRG